MADIPSKIKDLIESLTGADLDAFETALDQVLSKANQADQAAKSFFKNLKAGVDEFEAIQKAMTDTYGKLLDNKNQELETTKALIPLLSTLQALQKQQGDASSQQAKATEQALAAAKEKLKLLIKQEKVTDRQNKSVAAKLNSAGKKTSGAPSGGAGGLAGALQRAAAQMVTASPSPTKTKSSTKKNILPDKDKPTGAAGGGFATNAAAAAAALGFGGQLAQQGYDQIKLIDEQVNSFTRLIGHYEDGDAAVRKNIKGVATFSERIIQLHRANRDLGFGVQDIVEGYQNLFTTSRAFGTLMAKNTPKTRAQADVIADMSLKFKAAGLNIDTMAGALETIAKTYKKDDIEKKFKKFGQVILQVARGTGQLPDQIGKDLNNAMSSLAAYGLKSATRQFTKLAAVAAVTGVKTEELLGMTAKFDDMGQAADSVGELNAMLGGPYLNTLDLVNANEAERVEMLRDSVLKSGKSFDQLDRFTKKAIADQVGLDVEKTARLFMASPEDIEETLTRMKEGKVEYDNMAKGAAKNATSFQKQITESANAAVTVEGAFNTIDTGARNVSKTIQNMGVQLKKVIGPILVTGLEHANEKLRKLNDAIASGRWGELVKDGGKFLLAAKTIGFIPAVVADMKLDEMLGDKEKLNEMNRRYKSKVKAPPSMREEFEKAGVAPPIERRDDKTKTKKDKNDQAKANNNNAELVANAVVKGLQGARFTFLLNGKQVSAALQASNPANAVVPS